MLFDLIPCLNCVGLSKDIKKSEIGTCVGYKSYCIICEDYIVDWKSQPLLGRMPAFNLLLSSAIFCSGKEINFSLA